MFVKIWLEKEVEVTTEKWLPRQKSDWDLKNPNRRKVVLNLKRELAEREEQQNVEGLMIWGSEGKATVFEWEWGSMWKQELHMLQREEAEPF